MMLHLHRWFTLAFLAACANCATPVAPGRSELGGGDSPNGSFTAGSAAGGTNASGGGISGFSEPAVSSVSTPPPLSGGTLLVAADGTTAVASDPARDLVWIVDLEPKSVRSSIALQAHDEPGRLVEDAAGLIHVALRGGRAIATLDPRAGIVTMRRDACEEPRGIAYDAKRDLLHVACATGTLLTLPAAGGDPVRRLPLDGDLRDVIVDGDRLLISRFRSAEVLVVGSNGLLLDRWRMNPFPINGALSEPEVAWRTIAAPDGGAIMVHQSASMAAITTNIGGGYGNASSGGCTAIVHSHLSSFSHDGTPSVMMPEISGAVPLDVALTADKRTLAVAVAGNATEGGTLSGLMSAPQIVLTAVTFDHDPAGNNGDRTGGCGTNPPIAQSTSTAQTITAIAFAPNGDLVYQTWDPPTLGIATPTGTSTIVLPGETRKDTGHLVFHRTTSSGLACASCHPEGGEDGHVWNFADLGKRRTQSLRVGVIGTEPFHWGGELADLSALVHDVFERRMSGPPLEEAHVAALAHWLNGLRPWQPAAPADPTSVARGRDLFQSQSVGCASCHAGPKLTNNATVSVGTDAGTNGDAFQVPSLVGVGFRAPYLHDGCAPTLLDRFGPCGGGDRHGVTSSLDQAQLTDLVSYLQSL